MTSSMTCVCAKGTEVGRLVVGNEIKVATKRVRHGVWTDEETFLLIDTIAKLNIIQNIDGCIGRNRQYYRRIAEEFRRRNLQRDWVQISKKWKNLKAQYYLHLKGAHESGQDVGTEWTFFAKLHNILSERPRTKAIQGKLSGGPLIGPFSKGESDIEKASDENVTIVLTEEAMLPPPWSPSAAFELEQELLSSTSVVGKDKQCQVGQQLENGTEPPSTCSLDAEKRTASVDNEAPNTILKSTADVSEWRPDEADSDKLFLMSLHSILRTLSDERNLQFRIGVMNLLLQLKGVDRMQK